MKKIKQMPHKPLDSFDPETFLPSEQIKDILGGPVKVIRNNIDAMLSSPHYQDRFQANQTFTTSWINLFPGEETLFTGEHCGIPGFRTFLERQTSLHHEQRIKFPVNFVNFKGYANDYQCFELCVSEGLPNHLIINDIMLSNPEDPEQRMRCGIFDEILNRVEVFAKEDNYSHLILTAAYEHLVPVFMGRGFELLDCLINYIAIHHTRQGFILTKKLT